MNPEIIEIEAEDGHRRPGVFQFPEGEGPFPGVLVIHGGMGNYTEEALLKFANSENHPARHLVGKGYAVLCSDYRHPSHVNLEIDDTITAYETLRAHPQVIEDKVALCGTSHGAVCALYAGMRIKPACIVAEEAATDLAHRYRAVYADVDAVNGKVEAYLKLDKELFDELAERLGGTPDEVPEAWEQGSGHAQAHKIQSPVLIIAGRDSGYLPNAQSMIAALQESNREVDFEIYENANHAFWEQDTKSQPFPKPTSEYSRSWRSI